MSELEEKVDEVIRLHILGSFEENVVFADLERIGDPAFEAVLYRTARTESPSADRAAALSVLLRMTRHHPLARFLREVFFVAVALLDEPDQLLRAEAISVATRCVSLADFYRSTAKVTELRPLLERKLRLVARPLPESIEEHVRGFLSYKEVPLTVDQLEAASSVIARLREHLLGIEAEGGPFRADAMSLRIECDGALRFVTGIARQRYFRTLKRETAEFGVACPGALPPDLNDQVQALEV